MFKLTVVVISIALAFQQGTCNPLTSSSDGLSLRENHDGDVQADADVFIGFHGTNSYAAKFWMDNGFLARPPPPTNSFWDYVGSLFTGPKARSLEDITPGSSGADAELGAGLYIADSPDTTVYFAQNNAKANPGTTPKVCGIWAISGAVWSTIPKVWFPQKDLVDGLVQDTADPAKKAKHEKARENYIKAILAAHHVSATQASQAIRFSLLDRDSNSRTQTSQFVIPDAITKLFKAKECFDYTYGDANTKPLPDNLPSYNQNNFKYNTPQIRTQWNILPEDIPAGRQAVTDAGLP